MMGAVWCWSEKVTHFSSVVGFFLSGLNSGLNLIEECFGDTRSLFLVVSAGAEGIYDDRRGESPSLHLSGDDFLSGVT